MTAPTIHENEPEVQNADETLERLVWVGPLAVAATALANVLFYYFVTRLLQIPIVAPEQFPPPAVTPLPVTDIILFSLIFAASAVIVFALAIRFSRRSIRTYLVISTAVLLLSMFLPLKIPTPPAPMSSKWSLVMMHIIGAVVVVGVLLTLCPSTRQPKS